MIYRLPSGALPADTCTRLAADREQVNPAVAHKAQTQVDVQCLKSKWLCTYLLHVLGLR